MIYYSVKLDVREVDTENYSTGKAVTRLPLSVLKDTYEFTHADDLEVDEYGNYSIDIENYIMNLQYILKKYHEEHSNE